MSDLDDLERHELTCFHSLWCMWYFFNANPNFISRNPKKECLKNDGGNALDVYKSIEGIFQEVLRSINNLVDKELAKHIFEINWPLIVIVPKIQGKCLTDKVCRVNSSTLLNNIDRKLNWSNLIAQYTIPKEVLIKLNISI